MVLPFSSYASIDEAVSLGQARNLEKYLRTVFKAAGLDIKFSNHFIDCINLDKDLSLGELRDTFRDCVRKNKEKLASIDKLDNGYLMNTSAKLNVPFVLKRGSHGIELIPVNVSRGHISKGKSFKN